MLKDTQLAADGDAALERSLKGLKKLLDAKTAPLTKDLIKWRDRTGGDVSLFNRLCFGAIVWDRTLGRPSTATLTAGFRIGAWTIDEVLEYTPQGVVFRKLRAPCAVSLWDGEGDTRRHRVNFVVTTQSRQTEHYVEPAFAPDTQWTGASQVQIVRGFRAIEPSIIGFVPSSISALPVFEVVMKPLTRLVP